MPLLQKPPEGLIFTLEPEMERDVLQELAQELSNSWIDEIQEAFPNGEVGLSVPLTPAKRLARYMDNTPIDDIPLLSQPDYVENARLGLMNLPQSLYWQRLITELPKAAEHNISDFLRLLRDFDIDLG